MRFIFWLISVFSRSIIRMRYRLEINGLEEVNEQLNTLRKEGKKGGILFLSNHTSEIDAVMLITLLWSNYKPASLITEDMYNKTFIRGISDHVGAIAVPNFVRSLNSYKRKKWERALAKMVASIHKGKNFLIFPSGRLKRTPEELLKGASGVHEVLQGKHTPTVVLIRLSGLWGSSFSCAQLGAVPPIGKMYLRGAGLLFKNLFFLTPKRDVKIDFELTDSEKLKEMDRLELNQKLENWYGQPFEKRIEPVQNTRELFWSRARPKMARIKSKEALAKIKAPKAVTEAVFAHLENLMGSGSKKPKVQDDLGADLGLDSLDIAELITFLEKRFGVRGASPDDLSSVGSLIELATRKKEQVKKGLYSTCPKDKKRWAKSKSDRPELAFPEADNIPEAFFETCARQAGRIASYDIAASSLFTYKDLKKGAIALKVLFEKLPSKYVGIMLPASAASYLAVLGCQLAGKIPVMLNWTQGAGPLDSIVDLMKLKTVVTSKRFVDQVQSVDFGKTSDLFCFLEDLKKELSLKEKLKILFQSKKSAKVLIKGLKKPIQKTAAILFTSGTEGNPKAVGLSHKNILENQRSALKRITLEKEDTLFSILPPFHSFGFNVTGLMPWLYGIRNVFSPNPLDSSALVEGVKNWDISLFCAAPSFLHPVLEIGKSSDFKSVRIFITGAESMPEKTLKLIHSLKGKRFIEGYGMTECAPMVAINPDGDPSKGVGMPIPGVRIRIVDEKTHKLKPQGEPGLVLIDGPNVFSGYLFSKSNPFITLGKTKWYHSGDIGKLDQDGNLILTGRSKRIVKIGGEMISLALIEQKLIALADKRGWAHPLDPMPFACFAIEEESGKPKLALYTCIHKTKEEINAGLKELGFTNIVKISRILPIEHMPLTGAGKIDYQKLCQKEDSEKSSSKKTADKSKVKT